MTSKTNASKLTCKDFHRTASTQSMIVPRTPLGCRLAKSLGLRMHHSRNLKPSVFVQVRRARPRHLDPLQGAGQSGGCIVLAGATEGQGAAQSEKVSLPSSHISLRGNL